jgi:hypothetical protein
MTTSERPRGKVRYGRRRDAVLSVGARFLARTVRPLWYTETLVLSARYYQWLGICDWARDARRYRDRLELWKRAAVPRLKEKGAAVLEFGVADGAATRWWADAGVTFDSWHGFDTFQGLPTAWGRAGVPVMSAGVFTPEAGKGAVPRLSASHEYTWHAGLIENTLPGFSRPSDVLFVLVDVDLLEPTEIILNWLAKHGRAGDLVYFDEAFDPWNEGRAIRRALSKGLQLTAVAYTGSSLLVELR